jgi:1-acyl-sn-glycerol-3-phosphate acyltransferase
MPPRAADSAIVPPHRRFGLARTLAGAAAAAAVLVPAELVVRRVRPNGRPHLPWLFHKALSRALGLRIVTHGRPVRHGGVLFVSNHISYLDIPVLGSRILGAFVAKAEVAGWGLFGFLADMGRTLYIDRENRGRAGAHRNLIAERLAAGGDVILFPEGTNSDGVRVLPFKSSLFSVVEGPGSEAFVIQPVTIAYARQGGMPVTRGDLPDIAWIGDTELVPHARVLLKKARLRADIVFHDAVRVADFADRKALARHCHDVISSEYRKLMRGRG